MTLHETPHDRRLVAAGSGIEAAVCLVEHEIQREVFVGDRVRDRFPDRVALQVRRARQRKLTPVLNVPARELRALRKLLCVQEVDPTRIELRFRERRLDCNEV